MKKNINITKSELKETNFSSLFMIFFIVSFLGWCVETVYCYFRFDQWVSRGFLILPICPIYGFSVVTIYWLFGTYREGGVLLGKCRKQPLRAIIYTALAMLIPTLAELITGAFFHRVFDIRLWDYRMQKYNLWGYICLKFSVVFGILIAVGMRVVFPIIRKCVSKLPERHLYILSRVLLVITVLDCFVCFLKVIL